MINFKNKRVLIVVAHPDDELLGVGGTTNKILNEYDCIVQVLILGEGITSRSNIRDTSKWAKELKLHYANIERAKDFIGYQFLHVCNFPDNRFDTVPLLDIIKKIEEVKGDFKPDIIFTHHGGDLNIDHQKTFEAVITSCRPLEEENVKSIITFETMSGTEWRASSDPKHFSPNFFIEINQENLNAKISAMESYEFEKRSYPHPRSPKALKIRSQMWGIANGLEMAEAFQIVRILQK